MFKRSFSRCFVIAAIGVPVILTGCTSLSGSADASKPSAAPLMALLPMFTAPGVPATGPAEQPVGRIGWPIPANDTLPGLPGKGIAEHPMLYIGEGYNKIFLVNDGKVIWTYSTGGGNELDDIWMLTNGNILFSRMGWAGEVTPDKKVVWRMEAPAGTEIHAIQPLGLDRVFLIENGLPPKMMIINIKTGVTEMTHELAIADTTNSVHPQFRHARVTDKGTYLLPMLAGNKVVELDKDFKEIWSYKINKPWAAIRLLNGNTLITDESDKLTREVNPKGETVWEIKLSDLPEQFRLADCQSCIRLANGNTILCSRGNNGKSPQLVEVNPDKKVVWVLQDWKDLGPASALQVLNDPGIPENPGECQR